MSILTKLEDEVKELENNVFVKTSKLNNIGNYFDAKFRELRELLPLNTSKINSVMDLMEQIQRVLEKIDEVEGSISTVKEVPFEVALEEGAIE